MIAERETGLSMNPRFGGRVGLIAGEGLFPIKFVESARRKGMEVVCCGILDHADDSLLKLTDSFKWFGVAKLGGMIRYFKSKQVDCIVMAGKIHKVAMFRKWRWIKALPDFRSIKVLLNRKRKNNSDDSLLLSVVGEFEKEGIRVASALEICPDLLVKPGLLTNRPLSETEMADVRFGWNLAREMGRLDIGQSIIIRNLTVVAVEAIEGTDEAVKRGGTLCPTGGFVLVKVAKPEQDMRFDVPTVGARTIRTLKESGGRVLAIEADKTILIDADATIQLANSYGISILSTSDAEVQSQLQAA